MLSYLLVYQVFVVLQVQQPVLASEREVLLLNWFHAKFDLFISPTDVGEAPRAPDIVTAARTEPKQLKVAQTLCSASERVLITSSYPPRL